MIDIMHFHFAGDTGFQSKGCECLAQDEGSKKFAMGFGRILFKKDAKKRSNQKFFVYDPKLYVIIPNTSDPMAVILFVEAVWKLPRPQVVMNVTGGGADFPLSTDLQDVLNDVVEIARKTGAWVITGGMSSGIMRYFGEMLD